jgi:hypothetical protein
LRRTILAQHSDISRKVNGAGGVQIHSVFPAGCDRIDEFTIAATKVENNAVFWHMLLKDVPDQPSPNALAIGLIITEPPRVDCSQLVVKCSCGL